MIFSRIAVEEHEPRRAVHPSHPAAAGVVQSADAHRTARGRTPHTFGRSGSRHPGDRLAIFDVAALRRHAGAREARCERDDERKARLFKTRGDA